MWWNSKKSEYCSNVCRVGEVCWRGWQRARASVFWTFANGRRVLRAPQGLKWRPSHRGQGGVAQQHHARPSYHVSTPGAVCPPGLCWRGRARGGAGWPFTSTLVDTTLNCLFVCTQMLGSARRCPGLKFGGALEWEHGRYTGRGTNWASSCGVTCEGEKCSARAVPPASQPASPCVCVCVFVESHHCSFNLSHFNTEVQENISIEGLKEITVHSPYLSLGRKW